MDFSRMYESPFHNCQLIGANFVYNVISGVTFKYTNIYTNFSKAFEAVILIHSLDLRKFKLWGTDLLTSFFYYFSWKCGIIFLYFCILCKFCILILQVFVTKIYIPDILSEAYGFIIQYYIFRQEVFFLFCIGYFGFLYMYIDR